MPAPALKSLVEESDKTMSDAERYWDEAKNQAEEKGIPENSYNCYPYVLGIVKRRMGLASIGKVALFLQG